MAAIIVLTVFPILMIAAAVSDIGRLTIPNSVNLLLASLFLPCALMVQMPLEQLGDHALAGGIMLVVGFALFLPNYIGGGDAKLIAAAALWLGLDTLLPFIFYTAMFGGLFSLMIVSFRQMPLPAILFGVLWVERLHKDGAPLPYGMAISASGLIVFNQSAWISLIA